jgi:hypothetical protein
LLVIFKTKYKKNTSTSNQLELYVRMKLITRNNSSVIRPDILFNLNEQNADNDENSADENNNLRTTTMTTTTTTTTYLKSHPHHHHNHYLDSLVDKLNNIDVANTQTSTTTLPTSPSQKTLVNSSSSSSNCSAFRGDQSMSESSSRSASRNHSQCSFHAQSSSISTSSSSSSSSSGCSSSLSGSSINSDNSSISRSQPIQTQTYSTITSLKGHPLYKMQDKIRSGGFGDVYKGTRKYDQLPIAIKIISKKKISSWTMVRF